ncbi:MAG: DUF559 domain-containing protein [Phycisphaera sp.]|nr:DUF559 domain-containing protein [Phycisphaera sp.]
MKQTQYNTARRSKVSEGTRQAAKALRREMTVPERVLWNLLRNGQLNHLKFRRQHPIGSYIVDFCCPQAKLIIEVVGLSHAGTGAADQARTLVLKRLGDRVFRATNDEVLHDPDAVFHAIANAAGVEDRMVFNQRHRKSMAQEIPSPAPALERGGVK